jgi:hypothetical protein
VDRPRWRPAFLFYRRSVIAILEGELLVGEATGHLGGWGTIALRSRGHVERTCRRIHL